MNIAILLTAYNGENYLAHQLDSIIAQSCPDWSLLIRDDCSTDSTVDIVKSYSAKDSRIRLVETGVKRGPLDGFMWLLEQANADYFMFCDHDDVWIPEKVEQTLREMQKIENGSGSTPVVVGTDLSIVDENLNIINYSYRHSRTHYSLEQLNDRRWHLFYDDIPGCTMMLNNVARQISLPYPKRAVMHDWWIMVSVLWNGGKVGFVDTPTILYRQHSGNHTGVRKVRRVFGKFAHLKEISEKTSRQYESTRQFHHMGKVRFVLMKTCYMLKVQWNLRYKKSV